MSSVMTPQRRQALAVTEQLTSALPAVEGVCLFGSVARGDADPYSDIDLLILGSDRTLRPSLLRRRLSGPARDAHVSLAYHTPDSLETYLQRWSRFGAHLRREGEILFDRHGRLQDILQRDVPVSTVEELVALRQRLANYEHLERFGGHFLLVLAHLYRIGRAVVFALLAEREILEFDRDRAFALLRDQMPASRDAVDVLTRLRPFYEVAIRHDTSEPLPFSPYRCEIEVQNALSAIESLFMLSKHASVLRD